MAKDFKLTDTGDWDLSTGDFQWVEEAEEIAQLSTTKLLKVYDEDAYRPLSGIDWFGVMFNVMSDVEERRLEVRDVLLSIPEITDTGRVDIERVEHHETITLEMDSIYGPVTVVNS
jgi:hypothetical protein